MMTAQVKAMHGWLKMHLVIHSDTDDNKKKIPIVDDINDTGATFNWIMQDWSAGCLSNDPDWESYGEAMLDLQH